MELPAIERGAVARELAEDLPGLGLASVLVAGRAGASPRPVRRRLRELAGRIGGAHVVEARRDSVPWAYRVLWRRLGLDPDEDRTPVESLMLERLRHGGLPSNGMPADATVLATLETGVPVVALDADRVAGAPCLRPARGDEALGDGPERALRAGEVVYADARRPVARLSGDVADECVAGKATRSLLLCALIAGGVPAMTIEEALWTAADLVGAGGTLDGSDMGGPQ